MNTLTASVGQLLATTAPFDRLSAETRARLAETLVPQRYRMGQPLLVRDRLPAQVLVLLEGQARLLAVPPGAQAPVTLLRLGPGDLCGWEGLVRGQPCETVIASEDDTIALAWQADAFLAALAQEPSLAAFWRERPGAVELFDLIAAESARRARVPGDLRALVREALPEAQVWRGSEPPRSEDRVWLVSSGPQTGELWQPGFATDRLVGISTRLWDAQPDTRPERPAIPAAPDLPPLAPEPDDYPFVSGSNDPASGLLACLQMASRSLNLPWQGQLLRRVLKSRLRERSALNLPLCGAIAELGGLASQQARIGRATAARLPTPALLLLDGRPQLLYRIDEREVVVALPEEGIRRFSLAEWLSLWPEAEIDLLLLRPGQAPSGPGFGLGWFWPALQKYRRSLFEVLVASFVVQLFALANPLVTQLIIDKVLVQQSVETLNVLGGLLLVLAVFEAILASLRTYLFVDTTNRIDLSLGSEIIDHLLRLPLAYFDRRPVGELGTRVNELENIRQFLTGTALTVVLDAIFSVVYLAVMLVYSWQLTLVAMAVVPFLGLLTFIAAPIIRRRLRDKAERNAETQAFLVETLSGIQTVKAQNSELVARWRWQDRYARYVSAGFQTVIASTTVNAIGGFLSKLSGLMLLWFGAFLVLDGQLSLGQLIAFRIIAGYVTNPLLRLVQLWQSFQEVGLSIERLADILDTPREGGARGDIPMPAVAGAVRFEQVSFRYGNEGPPQLVNVDLDIPAGALVAIVGPSGSGKSTLAKLLARLYAPSAGRIFVDGYDVAKVELASLRSQFGLVLQEAVLFEGNIRDNIALTAPEATPEQIVEAAQVACAHDFVMALPLGYATRVGERGLSLSGGQRQRLAIARTVLADPRLIILDEATSALDAPTEQQVCRNLAEHFRGRTTLMITHRLSSIQHADRIFVMDRGSLVEQGTHSELMALQGRYYCMYRQQEAQT